MASSAGRKANGQLKKGYRVTNGGRVVKAGGKTRRSSPRRKRRGSSRGKGVMAILGLK